MAVSGIGDVLCSFHATTSNEIRISCYSDVDGTPVLFFYPSYVSSAQEFPMAIAVNFNASKLCTLSMGVATPLRCYDLNSGAYSIPNLPSTTLLSGKIAFSSGSDTVCVTSLGRSFDC